MSFRLIPTLAASIARAHPSLPQTSRAFRPAARLFATSSAARLSPRAAPSSFFTSRPTQVTAATSGAAPKLSSALPSPTWQPSSFTTAFLRRAFSTSRKAPARPTYYNDRWNSRGSGGSGGRKPPNMFTRFRQRIDSLPVMTVVYGLIGVNVAIYLLWQYAISSWQRFRDPELYNWMYKNFILSEANIKAGRLWTLITACFSHSTGSHILLNCLGLYFVAPAAAGIVGPAAFLGLYLGGGMFSSLISLAWKRVTGKRNVGSEGASGAIYTCLSFYGALFPQTTFLLFFVVPMPAWLLIGGIFAWDLFSAVSRPQSSTDSAGHIGGILAGLGAAMAVRRGRFGQAYRNSRYGRW